jgi:hypothetical protein
MHKDAHIAAYLNVGGVPTKLTPKEHDLIMFKTKHFKWEDNSVL